MLTVLRCGTVKQMAAKQGRNSAGSTSSVSNTATCGCAGGFASGPALEADLHGGAASIEDLCSTFQCPVIRFKPNALPAGWGFLWPLQC